MQWAVDHGAQVTNNSYGSPEDPGVTVQQAFANAEAAGLLHVAAALKHQFVDHDGLLYRMRPGRR